MPTPDERAKGSAEARPKITRRESWRLVWATYRTSLPYLLIFIIGMLAATWLITAVFFR